MTGKIPTQLLGLEEPALDTAAIYKMSGRTQRRKRKKTLN